ncbi:MAG: hypothetical protein QM495_06280 [Lutibacter sp.]|uniref:hypothetical protein n=1 Tax=Lutibacter sp. TaxID=1925666 RepID=UPI003858C28B
MENQKIANVQLQLSENCSEENLQLISTYWKLNEDFRFETKPRLIKTSFNLDQTELNKLISQNSTLSFFIHCQKCNSYEKQDSKSQTNFLTKTSSLHSDYSTYECLHCENLKREQIQLEQEKKRRELRLDFDKAIDNKNWKNLSNFEKILLGHSLEMDFNQLKKFYGSKLGQSQFITFIKALENIEKQNLLFLKRNSWDNYITNYEYLEKLLQHKDEIYFIKENSESSVVIDKETNEIKFKLTINEYKKTPDSPLYSGLVTFNERIVIEPGVEYTFAQWERAYNNLYLTLIPTSNLYTPPTQKPLSRLPISMREGIQRFFNNLGKNL